MTLRLADYVLAGELIHKRPHLTSGWLMIRGWKQPLRFELMGDPAPDLCGRRLYFEASPGELDASLPQNGAPLSIDPRQMGCTGVMTAHRLVRVFEGSVENFRRRSRLGEPPPSRWKRRLYLEWFGNNGRVVLDWADPQMHFLEEHDSKETLVALPPPEDPPFDADFPPDDLSEAALEASILGGEGIHLCTALGDDDAFDLLSEEVSRYLEDHFGKSPEEPLSAEKGEDALWAELELMDGLIEQGGGMELGEILGKTPDWKGLSEEQAERLLKHLVAQLARYRVAFDVCEHCDMRQAYRILVEELAHDARVHPELRGTDWVTHFSTAEKCPECRAEDAADWGAEI